MNMKRWLLVAVIIALSFIAVTAFAVYIVTNFVMIHQNLSVPSNPQMQLYRNDGTTPIDSGTDVTSLWSWTGTQFTLSLDIKNTGNTVLQTGLNNSHVPQGWVVSITGNGTLNQGATQSVTLIANPPSLNGGTLSGDFDLWIIG